MLPGLLKSHLQFSACTHKKKTQKCPRRVKQQTYLLYTSCFHRDEARKHYKAENLALKIRLLAFTMYLSPTQKQHFTCTNAQADRSPEIQVYGAAFGIRKLWWARETKLPHTCKLKIQFSARLPPIIKRFYNLSLKASDYGIHKNRSVIFHLRMYWAHA